MRLIDYPDGEMMMMKLADVIAGELTTCLTVHDRASLAVPGGSTPGPMFDSLSGADLGWDRVSVVLTDERWVPEDHDRSNTRLLRARLLTGRAAAADHVPMYLPYETPEAALDALAAGVAPLLPLSILLLGMGADMHCASLFPGSAALEAALAPNAPPVLAIHDAGDEVRVTLTGPVLRGAMSTHVLILGKEKREAVERAARMTPQEAPIALVLRDATVHWAASL